ncbi:MAG: PAS domain-containing protein, partial [Oceanidesulfovibrio sp.]
GKATPSFKLIETIARTFGTEPANLFLFPPDSPDKATGDTSCPFSQNYSLYITDVGFWEYDAVGDAFTWNDTVYQMFGVARQSFTPAWDGFMSLIQEEDRKLVTTWWKRLLSGEDVGPFTFRVRHPGAGPRYLIAKGLSRYNENGELAGICGVAIDYTEQKNLDDALRRLQQTLEEQVHKRTRELHSMMTTLGDEIAVRKRAEREAKNLSERLSLAMETASIGIWEYDRSTGLLHLEKPLLRSLGYDPSESDSPLAAWEDRIHPDDLAHHEAARDAHVHGLKDRYEATFRVRTADGGWQWFHAIGRLKHDVDLEKPEIIIGTFQNVTAIRHAEQAKTESEEQFRILVEHIREIFWIAEPDRRMSYVSPHFENLFQMDPEELRQNSLAFLQRVHPKDRPGVEVAIERFWADEDAYNETFRVLLMDGEIRWVKARAFPVYDEDGSIARAVGVVEDVTAMETMTRRLEQAKEEAEKASRAKSGFIANMSHEIRTPVTGMLALLQLLSHTSLDEEQREFVALAKSSGAALLETINDVLDISRIETGQIQVERSTFSLRQLLDSIDSLFQPLARQNGIELRTHCDSAIPAKLHGDSGRIKQILFNLTGYTVKFTRQGRVTISATHDGFDDGGRHFVVFQIKDTGPGIPENHITNILENFAHINEPTYVTDMGAGLGLAIVKLLAELMGGSMEVECDSKTGSTIRMRLPLEAIAEESASAGVVAPPTGARRLRALVAEDDSVSQAALCRMLQILGHDVVCASNGTETLDRLKKDPIDLLMLDIRMPDLNGYEVAKCIREGALETVSCDLPIIAVTAFAMQEDRERILGAGVDDLLIKPFTMEELQAKLHGVAP